MRATDMILQHLDRPKPNRYSIDDVLGATRGADMTLDQLQHYLACRRARECFKDQESVFEELVRLAAQADEETTDAFARITNGRFDKRRARVLAFDAVGSGVAERILVQVAYGMLRDGWPESQVAFGLGTLGTMPESQAA